MERKTYQEDPKDSTSVMINRRNVLAGAGAGVIVAAASVSPALAAEHKMGDHAAHGAKKYQAVTESALHCVMMGQACIEHCLTSFKSGDTSLVDCARMVQQMVPMCRTMAQFASMESAHIARLAAVCIEVCAACEKECRKHADVHPDCKNCAESCLACIEQCRKIAA